MKIENYNSRWNLYSFWWSRKKFVSTRFSCANTRINFIFVSRLYCDKMMFDKRREWRFLYFWCFCLEKNERRYISSFDRHEKRTKRERHEIFKIWHETTLFRLRNEKLNVKLSQILKNILSNENDVWNDRDEKRDDRAWERNRNDVRESTVAKEL